MIQREQDSRDTTAGPVEAQPRAGSVRACVVYRDELARHRVMSADGLDYLVATVDQRLQGRGFVTAAYPVARGYLVMMRQPLCTLVSEGKTAAHRQHTQLVEVLAQAGAGVVKARRRSAEWRRAERRVDTVELTDARQRGQRRMAAHELADAPGVAEASVAVAGATRATALPSAM
ncbi:MAG TPA: hypothetical protein VGN32_08995 [Ktedonobacterales bacterium]|nr:hypothetical protein [Ktedonobacterales bacterium]